MDGASGEAVSFRYFVASLFLIPVFLRQMQRSFCMTADVPLL